MGRGGVEGETAEMGATCGPAMPVDVSLQPSLLSKVSARVRRTTKIQSGPGPPPPDGDVKLYCCSQSQWRQTFPTVVGMSV